jgi:uncharacterized protein involved in tellurium resistance
MGKTDFTGEVPVNGLDGDQIESRDGENLIFTQKHLKKVKKVV